MMPEDQEREGDDDEIGPGDPDYDLSEAHGYMWEPARPSPWPPRWLLAVISFVVIVALVLPAVLLILYRG